MTTLESGVPAGLRHESSEAYNTFAIKNAPRHTTLTYCKYPISEHEIKCHLTIILGYNMHNEEH